MGALNVIIDHSLHITRQCNLSDKYDAFDEKNIEKQNVLNFPWSVLRICYQSDRMERLPSWLEKLQNR